MWTYDPFARGIVVEDDCGCTEVLSPGARVRMRYDLYGRPWIVSWDTNDEACCTCTDEPIARSARGPRYGGWNPYRGVYGRSRYTQPAMRECTE